MPCEAGSVNVNVSVGVLLSVRLGKIFVKVTFDFTKKPNMNHWSIVWSWS